MNPKNPSMFEELFYHFLKIILFYVRNLSPTPNPPYLEDYPFSALRFYLFNMFASTRHI
jgi:hypothetical protein